MMKSTKACASMRKPTQKYMMGTKMKDCMSRYGASTSPVAIPNGNTAYIDDARSLHAAQLSATDGHVA